jgi:hypothetical protein
MGKGIKKIGRDGLLSYENLSDSFQDGCNNLLEYIFLRLSWIGNLEAKHGQRKPSRRVSHPVSTNPGKRIKSTDLPEVSIYLIIIRQNLT